MKQILQYFLLTKLFLCTTGKAGIRIQEAEKFSLAVSNKFRNICFVKWKKKQQNY
jgi:hypothetical protein